MGRRCRPAPLPSKLIDRVWRVVRGSFVLTNDRKRPLLSKNGTSMTGSSLETTRTDSVWLGTGDANGGGLQESGADQVRGMGDENGDEMEDGNTTVELTVSVCAS